MKRRVIEILCAALVLGSVAACGTKEDTATPGTEQLAEETEVTTEDDTQIPVYQSKVVSLGNYKDLSYTDESGREPTDEEVEEEMQAILAWYEDSELTDEWVQENLELDSVEAFRENTRESLKEVYNIQARKTAIRELYSAVIENSEFELDETEVNTQRNDYIWGYQQMADAADMSYEDYISDTMGMTVEEFETKAGESAEQVVEVEVIACAIADAESLDVEAAYDEIAAQIVEEEGFDSVEELENQAGGKSAVSEEVRYRLVGQFLMEHGEAVQESTNVTEM